MANGITSSGLKFSTDALDWYSYWFCVGCALSHWTELRCITLKMGATGPTLGGYKELGLVTGT